MKSTANTQNSSKKLIQALVGVMVIGGIIVFAVLSNTDADGTLMSKLFLAFFGLIIAAQFIPGIALFSAMIKGVCNLGRKSEVLRK